MIEHEPTPTIPPAEMLSPARCSWLIASVSHLVPVLDYLPPTDTRELIISVFKDHLQTPDEDEAKKRMVPIARVLGYITIGNPSVRDKIPDDVIGDLLPAFKKNCRG